MSVQNGARHADMLDRGANLLSLLPPDYITAIRSSYFGEKYGGGLLTFEQSPYIQDFREQDRVRLSILGIIGGMAIYGDERGSDSVLGNGTTLPGGIDFSLATGKPRMTSGQDYHQPRGTVESCVDISSFVRGVEGHVWSAKIAFDTEVPDTIGCRVRGVFVSDDMLEAYLESIDRGIIVEEHSEPATPDIVASISHTVLTPTTGQIITFSMSDHRSAWYAAEAAREWREGRNQGD